MITFKQFIVELGNRKIEYKVVSSTDSLLELEAVINGRLINFFATALHPRVFGDGVWNVSFAERWYDDEEGEWIEATNKTGKGGEFEVLSFITAALKELLKKSPMKISFSASKELGEEPRTVIYRKIADKILKDYERKESSDNLDTHFTYVKKTK